MIQMIQIIQIIQRQSSSYVIADESPGFSAVPREFWNSRISGAEFMKIFMKINEPLKEL
ncbi:hypothetical protein [Robinsoniella peoriensis]|uniref:hypothetical protein n=1 Tax=Robinsoniella peoriensis TaxID=180332 RepID=UPI00363C1BE2